MRMIKHGVVALAMLGLAGPAVSAERAEARLASPVAESRQVIIDGRLWSCMGDRCVAGSQGRSQPIGRECLRVAKIIGPIIEYRQGDRTLSPAGVAACNGAPDAVGPAHSIDLAPATS